MNIKSVADLEMPPDKSISINDGKVNFAAGEVGQQKRMPRAISSQQPLKRQGGGPKKRIKSTRPGGIRGGVLVSEKYGKVPATPQTKKVRATSHMKQMGRASSSKHAVNAGKSTNAASSTNQ